MKVNPFICTRTINQHIQPTTYKYNRNVQDFIIYIVNNCNKFCIARHYHNNKEERQISEHPHRREQEHAEKRHQMRAVTGQGCTQGESDGSKRDKQEIKNIIYEKFQKKHHFNICYRITIPLYTVRPQGSWNTTDFKPTARRTELT